MDHISFYYPWMTSAELLEHDFKFNPAFQMFRTMPSLTTGLSDLYEMVPIPSSDEQGVPLATPSTEPDTPKEEPSESGSVGIDPRTIHRTLPQILEQLIKTDGIDVVTVGQILQTLCVHPGAYNSYCQIKRAHNLPATEFIDKMLPILERIESYKQHVDSIAKQ
ncbi:hypothetical protein BDN72DRAFT_840935, partial [Pluteus cervinus]